MSSEQDLLRQIAALSGAIDKHQARARGRRERDTKPYARRPARALPSQHRNRTLVLNGTQPSIVSDSSTSEPSKWISSRDRGHMTLTNSTAYTTTTATKIARIHETRAAKIQARLLKREAKEAERLRTLASKTLVHEGITFHFNTKASLLVRDDESDVTQYPTPLQTFIHGVEFLKSPKSNNLYRKTTVKLNASQKSARQSKKYCKYYTRNGVCKRAKECPYLHDENHLAICSHFLSVHGCDESRGCTLSHNPTPQNTPSCTHFLKGSCSRPDYFARIGYCGRGLDCSMRHVRECPLFSNTGACNKKRCKLPHVERAKSHTQSAAVSASDVNLSQESESDSDYGTDDYEAEDFDEHSFGEFVKL